MLDKISEFSKFISTAIAILEKKGQQAPGNILKLGVVSPEWISHDNWNGGIDYYRINIELDLDLYSTIENEIANNEHLIEECFQQMLRGHDYENITEVIIKPKLKYILDWNSVSDISDKVNLIQTIESLREMMISVSTGGASIDTLNQQYKQDYAYVADVLAKLGLVNPNPFKDLWNWYHRWKASDLPSYADRRIFIGQMYEDLLETLQSSEDIQTTDQPLEMTGWEKVDRTIIEMRKRMREASTEEQFQSIGLLGREMLISLAQEVYKKGVHKILDGTEPSETDAKRKLEAFIATELAGGSNEELRKYSKACISLANYLTHHRTANSKDASLCLISVISTVNMIKVLSRHTIIRF